MHDCGDDGEFRPKPIALLLGEAVSTSSTNLRPHSSRASSKAIEPLVLSEPWKNSLFETDEDLLLLLLFKKCRLLQAFEMSFPLTRELVFHPDIPWTPHFPEEPSPHEPLDRLFRDAKASVYVQKRQRVV